MFAVLDPSYTSPLRALSALSSSVSGGVVLLRESIVVLVPEVADVSGTVVVVVVSH
jgi:hypothetical protein